MPRPLSIALCSIALLVSGLAVTQSAQAAGHSLSITTNYIGMTESGVGRVYAWCNSSKTCKGSIYLGGDTRKTAYTVAAGARKFIALKLTPGSGVDPYTYGTPVGMIKRKKSRLKVAETSPRKITHDYGRKIDTQLPRNRQFLTGTITGADGSAPVENVKVKLIELKRGGAQRIVNSVPVTMDKQGDGTWKGTYRFGIRTDSNNRPLVTTHFLKIEGDSAQGVRSWWWRGYSNRYVGGSRYVKEASPIVVDRYSNFVADFAYGYLEGEIAPPVGGGTSYAGKSGVDITVAAPITRSYGSDTRSLQALDIEYCANVFARTKTTNGAYRVDFLPLGSSRYVRDNRYMVGAQSGSNEMWVGGNVAAEPDQYGSCYDAMEYATYRSNPSNLLKLDENSPVLDSVDIPLSTPTRVLTVKMPPLFRGALANDKWITVREKIPGVGILDSPVVAEGRAFKSNQYQFVLPRGRYWVETGRRTSCSAWYPSVYTSNNAYFSGADRGAERWKTISGKKVVYAKSTQMGFVAKNPPRGYKGWMYRDYCKSLSAGTYDWVDISTSNRIKTVKKATKGAIVYGKVTRAGGRTNKEMMVRVSHSGSTAVLRTDLTDSSGRFYVAGLMPGSYTISVNSDSWRGIGRAFTGKRTIKVSGSRTYNVGTLHFKS